MPTRRYTSGTGDAQSSTDLPPIAMNPAIPAGSGSGLGSVIVTASDLDGVTAGAGSASSIRSAPPATRAGRHRPAL